MTSGVGGLKLLLLVIDRLANRLLDTQHKTKNLVNMLIGALLSVVILNISASAH
jgi:hypothetical protein